MRIQGIHRGDIPPDGEGPVDNPYFPFENASVRWWWNFYDAAKSAGDNIRELSNAWLSLRWLDHRFFCGRKPGKDRPGF